MLVPSIHENVFAFVPRSGSAAGVAKVVVALRENGAMRYTVVVTEGNDRPGLPYIAPDAAISIANYFIGKSVSRVGGKKAQGAVYRAATGDLKLDYGQFEELAVFVRFRARLKEDTRPVIEHGRHIRACLEQPESAPVCVTEQIVLLLALGARLLDNVPLDRRGYAELTLIEAAANLPAECQARIPSAKSFSDEDGESILRPALAGTDGLGFAAPVEAGNLNPKPDVVGYFNTGTG
jgi:F-type H+-transporting ATPase subunit alpha